MTQLQWFVGIEQDKNGNPITDLETKLTEVRRLLAENYSGWTETYGFGGWRDPATGEVVSEKQITFSTIYDASIEPTNHAKRALRLGETIKIVMNQSCVLLTSIPIRGEFI